MIRCFDGIVRAASRWCPTLEFSFMNDLQDAKSQDVAQRDVGTPDIEAYGELTGIKEVFFIQMRGPFYPRCTIFNSQKVKNGLTSSIPMKALLIRDPLIGAVYLTTRSSRFIISSPHTNG